MKSHDAALETLIATTRQLAAENVRLLETRADLLALLKELIDIEGPQPGTAQWAEKVRAAIAKVEGRS